MTSNSTKKTTKNETLTKKTALCLQQQKRVDKEPSEGIFRQHHSDNPSSAGTALRPTTL